MSDELNWQEGDRIVDSMRSSARQSIVARWDFGRWVLSQRVGAKLPTGRQVEIIARYKMTADEINRCARLASHYDREFIIASCDNEEGPPPMDSLLKAIPPKRKDAGVPKKTTKPPPAQPTRTTIAEADRMQALAAKPEVRAEVLRRDADDKVVRQAQAVVEKAERQEARDQRQRDQEHQALLGALHRQLVRAGGDWLLIAETLETASAIVNRIGALVDDMPPPDSLQLRVLDTQLGKLQTGGFSLRQRLFPDYEDAAVEVWRTSVIDVP